MKKETFTTYCINDFEDIIITAAFRDISNGFYIDIGANDPIVQNVTKFLYNNKQWNGINIEPLQKEYLLLCKDRPRDINLNIGISDKEEVKTLYMDGGLSTCDKSVVQENRKEYIEEKSIKLYTLTSILDKYLKKNMDIHFCKIDVEGFEKNVLTGIDFNKYRPFLFCMESTLPCTDIPSYQNWENILINNNYSLVFSYGVNRYYADKTCKNYEQIKNNLMPKHNLSRQNRGEENVNNIKIFIKKLKNIWHFCPIPNWIRTKLYLFRKRLSIKKSAYKLAQNLNLNLKIKIYKIL